MKKIQLTQEEVDALLERVKANNLTNGDYDIIKSMADAVTILSQALNKKATSIKRLLTMLLGAKTEKKDKVLKNTTTTNNNNTTANNNDKSKKGTAAKPGSNKKKAGHGRIPACDYTGADRVSISHDKLKHKDPCPLCPNGKLYKIKDPGVAIRINGQALLNATVYELEKLRCNLCGEVFTAAAPDNTTGKQYDETAKAMIALLKYGCGFPWYRLAGLQKSLGIPVPASILWENAESSADHIYPAFDELMRQAAQGNVFQNDDTTMKILDLIKENQFLDKKERTGIFTSGIISVLDDDKWIALFFTGRCHAGENIASLYDLRNKEKPPPLQMCDTLSRNMSSEFKIILIHCMVHARRNFVDVVTAFPDECRHVIEILAKVYETDAIAKTERMSPEERLTYHQTHSGPKMKALRTWLDKQINEKLVEPNSGIGNAIAYMRKHWTELTQFLRVPGAPLDNNICEQALKRSILNRKNALFYKTQHGAYIGDMFMSLIHTCSLMKVNPFNYLVALQKYSARVFKNPSQWMPWNYETAATLAAQSA
ncbi:IS66 family transposase [Desulfobacula toluolica]|uniref:Transposase, IS66 family n=1 Tax=Desulfobacula toluolica (strain DSM 7467 / Tol2) TaxID=651182 RepID=K0NNB8_DESTT|nr:IS66 family transposase [Desulfobacula toluolica]CCK80237.1 transposase, IS66 family [Desulfobacula toluolica Tol2]